MSNLKLVFALGVAALSACGTDPTASGVFPAEGFTGRSLRVQISGDATDWKDGATVSFGDGVTVGTVTVASPTSVFAEVTVDPNAAEGLRDVTVSSNGSVTLKQAFELVSPLSVSFQGDAAQGGIPYFTITSHDFDNPFDLTQDSAGDLANLLIEGPTGTQFLVDSASSTPYIIKGFAEIDGDAAPGPLKVTTGPAGMTVTSVYGSVPITTRAPMALSGSTSGTLAKIGDSLYYSLAAAGTPSLVHISLSTSDQDAAPRAAILDSNGHWATPLGGTVAVLQSAATVNVVVYDNGTAAGYNLNITGAGEMLNRVAEPAGAGNQTTGGAPTAAIPYNLTAAKMDAATDVDFLKVVVAAGDAGKHLHISTRIGTDDFTDTDVNLMAADGTTVVAPGDNDDFICGFFGVCGEEFISGALPAATYYIKVEAGASWVTSDQDYELLAWFE